jgi:hypothetical protein
LTIALGRRSLVSKELMKCSSCIWIIDFRLAR